MTLQEFLTRFGEPLAQRVTETFNILHDPVRDLGTTPDLDQRLATLLRPCYPAQGEAAKALARAYFENGQQAALLSGEMGVANRRWHWPSWPWRQSLSARSSCVRRTSCPSGSARRRPCSRRCASSPLEGR